MADKATRERLKRQAEQARAERQAEFKPPIVASKLQAKKEKEPAKIAPPRPRKCCESFKKSPHLPDCPTLHVKPAPPRPKYGTPGFKDWQQNKRGRLPGGAQFEATYSESTSTWEGRLTVNHDEHGFATFGDSASGVFRLMANLDVQYRKWTREQDAAKVAKQPVTV